MKTAHLEDGVSAALYPISGGKTIPGLPRLNQAQDAGAVHLSEINPKSTPVSKEKGKGVDWLSLLVRETLGMFDSGLDISFP